MNKNTFLITAALVSGLFWVGCDKSGKLNTTSTFKPPSGPVELKVKWPAGEQVVQTMELKQTAEISVPNQPNPLKQDTMMEQKYGLSVVKEKEVELEILGIRMDMTMAGKPIMNYDSDKKSSADKSNPLTAMFQKVIGAKIQYYMDSSNQVERMEGVDALLARLETGNQPDMTSSLKSMFNEGYFKQIMDTSRYQPSKPVQPGDTWPVQMEIPMGPVGVLKIDYTVTFQSWEQHGKRMCARLETQGTIKSTPDANSAASGMNMNISDGNVTGVSWFDPELGMVIEATADQDMKMTMTVPMGGPRGNAAAKTQTIPLALKQLITIKLESVK